MKNWYPCLLLFLLLGQLSAQTDKLAEVERSLRPDLIVEGEPLWTLAARMENHEIPGLSLAVVDDFALAVTKSYGKRQVDERDPVTTETVFQAASISKLVNAVGILKLVEAGQLDLDRDVNDYLTSWKLAPNADFPDAVVTTRMLLAHTAGLTSHGFGGYKTGEDLPTTTEILSKGPGVNSERVKIFKQPGVSFKYSGGGTTITQLLVEDLTGLPYPQYVREQVLQPLKMIHSFYSVNQAGKEDRLATAHLGNGKPLKNKYQHYPESAAAGLWTTPSDLSKLMIELMRAMRGDADRILLPATVRAMTVPPTEDGNSGLGMFVREKQGHVYFDHGGSNRGFRAFFIGSTTSGDGAVVMVNSSRFDLIPEVLNAIALTYDWPGWFGPDNTLSRDFTPDKSAWKSYPGHYVSEGEGATFVDVSLKKGRLIVSRGKEWKIPLVPLSRNRFLFKNASPAATVVFPEDGLIEVTQNGKTTRFHRQ
ncbi:MAG: serine hydrolase domain-containing protein [Bacteroidota bacterium]